jgi:CDGSH-type Zn-finger protein
MIGGGGRLWSCRCTGVRAYSVFFERKMASTKITVNHNGSIRIEGDFEIVDPEGKPFGLAGRSVISLCRCGHSANKPFCDGSHKTSGFADTVAARELPPSKPKL